MPTQSWNPNAVQKTQSGAGRFLTKRMIIMLVGVLGILGLVFAFIIGKGIFTGMMMSKMVMPVSISTVTPQHLVWQEKIQAVGSLHAAEGADLAPEVAGLITRIGFSAGQDVRKGALLVQMRDDAERAAADQAMSAYKRSVQLLKSNAVSQSDYDTAEANMRSTKAALDKKAIRAPFDGRVGIRQVDAGAYVAAGTTLVTLQQLNPIYADFKVAQQDLPRLKVGSKITLTTDTFPGKVFRGEVSAFDPKVDEATRTVQVRATIGNPNKLLLPGMFGEVRIETGMAQNLMTLPQTAITYNTYGNVVYVVKKTVVDGKTQLVAEQRVVVTGDTRGDQVAILSGLKDGDVVVSSGSNKLKNGTVLRVNNAVTLPNDATPNPSEETD